MSGNIPTTRNKETADAFHCSNQAIGKALKRPNITRKKTRRYKKRDKEKIAAYPETPEDIPPEKRVYMDQSGSDSCYGREYGCAPRGEQVFGEIYGRKFARTNLIAAQIDGKAVAPM